MNSQRKSVDPSTFPIITISPNWLIGFIEGEGSFLVRKNWLTPVFSIAQNNKSSKIIVLISQFILSLPFIKPSNVKISYKEFEFAKNKLNFFKEQNKTYIYEAEKVRAIQFSIQNLYFLFYNLLPSYFLQ